MSVLILNAGSASPIAVLVQSASENQPTEIGTVTPSFAGADRSSVRAIKRNYGSLTTFVSTATKDSIINLLKNGRQIPCSGDLLANIQTQCTVRYLGATMSPSLTDFWTVGLALNEVQPNNILLRLAPGDVVTGEVFTRSTVGYQTDVNGLLVSKAINVKRDGHYIGGVASILLEDTRTNVVLWNRDLTNAAWTKTTMTTAHTSTGADGTASGATRLTASAGNATALQAITLGSSARFQSAYVRRITGTGTIQMTTDNGATWTTIVTTAAWTLVSIPTQTLANPTVGFRIVTNADAIDVDFVQNETGTFGSSPIATTTVAVTRGADSYSLPFTTPPQEVTVYVKFVEGGSISANGTRLWQISNAANATPEMLVSVASAVYAAEQDTTVGGVASGVSPAPTISQVVENLARLFGDGRVDATQSIGSGAATTGTQSAALALATAWSGLLCWLNSAGTSGGVGFTAIQSFKIAAGMRSLDEMRAA